nr:MAG TPA: hypothetical protein [Caudoviricetes sp.]
MGKYFTFVDRLITLEFFGEDTVKATVAIGDEMDKRIDAAFGRLKKPESVEDKKAEIAGLIGADVTDKILERLDTVDGYALDQLLLYIRETYLEAKVKNLQAAKAGRKRK